MVNLGQKLTVVYKKVVQICDYMPGAEKYIQCNVFVCVLVCVWGAGEEGGGVEIFADILDQGYANDVGGV